jgi:hypothetical protein
MNLLTESVELLAHVYQDGPLSMAGFKDAFPKLNNHSRRMYDMLGQGLVRRVNGMFVVTEKGRDLLAAESRVTTAIAGKRDFEAKGHYTATRTAPMRPGAEDHLQIPSLIGGRRVYRKDSGRA